MASAGLDLRDYRLQTFARRLPACLRALKVASIADARERLLANPALLDNVLSLLLLGVTNFFRDPLVFSTIRNSILPMLSRQARPRVWSAACSNGAELVSVAMLLEETGDLNRSELLGTDVRRGAIRDASAGRYHARSLGGLSDDLIARHFVPCRATESSWIVRRSLRSRLSWRHADALAGAEPGRWDLILCRNMAMYVQSAVAAKLWHQLEQSLRPGGFLVVGKAEKPDGTTTLEPFAPCIYRRQAHADPLDLGEALDPSRRVEMSTAQDN